MSLRPRESLGSLPRLLRELRRERAERFRPTVVLEIELTAPPGCRYRPNPSGFTSAARVRTQCSGRQVARQWPSRAREASIRAQRTR